MAETFGASFTIDISNLKAGLNTANKLIRESQTNFQKAAAGLDNWTKSEQGLQAKIASLNNIIPIQEKKVAALKAQYEKLSKEGMKETENRAIELRTQINREEAALESNRAELKRQTDALNELQNASEDAGDAIEETGKQTEKTTGAFTVMKGALANLVADGFRAAISAAKNFTKELVQVGISFDDSMAQVAAVSGATGAELETLRDKAKELGASTKFTATEVSSAFNFMAMAGWKTEDMLGGIEGILNLAAASGADLATTSDIVTDALTAMGYAASDAGRLADVMAAASSNANTNVELMGLTFQYAAPLVGALGFSMEDTAKAIGLMANAGIKGEKAGTALRSIMTRLANPPKDCAESLNELGVSLTDSSGKMKTLDEVMQELRDAFADLDEVEQATHASNIAGQEALSGMLAIVNAAPEDYKKLTDAIKNSEGAALSMASTMLDTLGGDMTVLKSQIEGVRLTIYEHLSPTLRDLVKDAQEWLSSVDWKSFGKKAGDALKTIISYGKSFAKNVLPTLQKALKIVGNVVKFVIDNFKVLAATVGTAIIVFKTFKAVLAVTTAITAAKTAIAGLTAGINLATKAQKVWNAAMASNPIGAVVTATALLAGGIAMLVTKNKQAAETTDYLSESQRKAVDAAKEAADAFRDEKNAIDQQVGAQVANVNYVKNSLLPELQNLIDANGEVKTGEEARATFILGELNKALGTEYEDIHAIVDENGKLKDSIYDVIDAKKAQIMLEGYEDQYREAVAATAEAESRRATELRALSDAEYTLGVATYDLTKYQNEYNEAKENGNVLDRIGAAWAKKNAEDVYNTALSTYNARKKAYEDATADAEMYYDTITTYETASTAVLEGETQKAVELLSQYGGGFITAAQALRNGKEEALKTLGDQVINTEIAYQQLVQDHKDAFDTMSEDEKKAALAAQEEAKNRADNAKKEFKAVGGNITEGIAEGAEQSSWMLNKAMQKIIDDALKAAKNAADSHSPSRLFEREVGKNIGLGIAVGVTDSTKSVVRAVKNQVKTIRAAYDIDGLTPAVNAGVNDTGGAGSVNNSRVVTVNQYNTYSQAHSRYELYKSKQQTAAAVRLALAGG